MRCFKIGQRAGREQGAFDQGGRTITDHSADRVGGEFGPSDASQHLV